MNYTMEQIRQLPRKKKKVAKEQFEKRVAYQELLETISQADESNHVSIGKDALKGLFNSLSKPSGEIHFKGTK